MSILFTILILLVAILLIGVVLIQNSKGGGLASNIGVSTQMMGVKKTADTVEKATWYLVGLLAVLCVASGFAFSGGQRKSSSGFDPQITPLENTVPMNQTAPVTTNQQTPPVQ